MLCGITLGACGNRISPSILKFIDKPMLVTFCFYPCLCPGDALPSAGVAGTTLHIQQSMSQTLVAAISGLRSGTLRRTRSFSMLPHRLSYAGSSHHQERDSDCRGKQTVKCHPQNGKSPSRLLPRRLLLTDNASVICQCIRVCAQPYHTDTAFHVLLAK